MSCLHLFKPRVSIINRRHLARLATVVTTSGHHTVARQTGCQLIALKSERLLRAEEIGIYTANALNHRVAAMWPGVVAISSRAVADVETHHGQRRRLPAFKAKPAELSLRPPPPACQDRLTIGGQPHRGGDTQLGELLPIGRRRSRFSQRTEIINPDPHGLPLRRGFQGNRGIPGFCWAAFKGLPAIELARDRKLASGRVEHVDHEFGPRRASPGRILDFAGRPHAMQRIVGIDLKPVAEVVKRFLDHPLRRKARLHTCHSQLLRRHRTPPTADKKRRR